MAKRAARVPLTERPYRLLDNDQKAVRAADVIEALQGGATITEQAAVLQVSESHLREFLRRNGYRTQRQPTLWKQVEASAAE